jgi:F0F1-type ATP synthase membrane subunit b/b'
MQQIVHQLGELFLQAVPTVLIVLAFYLVMRALFFKPLLAVMAERDARTVGARKAAAAAEAAAAEKFKQYQEALRKARVEVYAEQEAARKKVLDERAAKLKEARAKATEEVAGAKELIAKELADALKELRARVQQLAAEIARRVLQIAPRPGGSTREAR